MQATGLLHSKVVLTSMMKLVQDLQPALHAEVAQGNILSRLIVQQAAQTLHAFKMKSQEVTRVKMDMMKVIKWAQ